MLTRRQALRLREPAFPLLLLIFSFLLAAPLAVPARQIEVFTVLLALLSAVTLVVWRYHRRDYASPRRIGRRI
jgi:hypothetical protein